MSSCFDAPGNSHLKSEGHPQGIATKKNKTMNDKILANGLCLFLFCSCLHADTHTADSPAYADVSKALADAAPGDTVLVPAGNATWANQLKRDL
jgi:hypothetical protein